MSQPTRGRSTPSVKRGVKPDASFVTVGKKPIRNPEPDAQEPISDKPCAEDLTLHEEVSHDMKSSVRGEAFQESAAVSEVLPEFQEQVAQTYSRDVAQESATAELPEPSDAVPIDAWYASFGTRLSRVLASRGAGASMEEITAEVLIGHDDRQRVTNTLAYPYGCICHLSIRARNGGLFVGTGWLADEQTVITAGHCLYMHREGGWAASIDVYPGRNGNSIPRRARAERMWSTRGWTEQRSAPADYGAIRLDKKIEGVGTFGFGALTNEELKANLFHIVGYPADKRGEMWGHGRRLSNVQSDVLIYDIDTYGGNSGGPLFLVRNGDSIVVGIHNYGDVSGNSATRITNTVYKRIQGWISA